MITTSFLLALALGAEPRAAAAANADPFIAVCEITSINDQSIPGADAGVLKELLVTEGSKVTRGMEIGRVDDSEAKAQLEIKKFEYDVAAQQATSDIDYRHAKKATEVAEATVKFYKEANQLSAKTVTQMEMLKHELEYEKAKLATEQTLEEHIEAKLTAKAKNAEMGAAGVALERRILRAPFDGVVVAVKKKPGEWVTPGDPVVHVVGVKRLRVIGYLDANQWGPADVDGRAVTIEVALPRGRTVRVPGKVTYVSPQVDVGRLDVWAEFDTPEEDGRPVVRAGLNAAMTIHVSQPVAESSPPGRVRRASVQRTNQ